MSLFERVFNVVTSLVLVCLTLEPGLGMTLSDDQTDVSTGTRMAPADDQLELTSQMSVTQAANTRYTESREVQEHINRLFTYEADALKPTRRPGKSAPRTQTLEVPQCATEHTYCTEGEAALSDDISEAVDQLLGSNPAFGRQYNATDILTQEDKTIIQRGPDDPDENHLCGFKVELSRVTWATSENNVVMRIAQSRDFAQAVRLEHCTDHNCGCHAMFTSGLPGRYVARCKQKYVYRQLLALTEDAKRKLKLVPHSFPLPSCCSCVITKQLDVREGDEECKKDKQGLEERIASDENSPPNNMDQPPKSTASSLQSHRKHLLLYIMWTAMCVSISFIYSHFK